MPTKTRVDEKVERKKNQQPIGMEKRAAVRTETLHQVTLMGNYGSFSAYVTNLSFLGAMIDVANSELRLPPDRETIEMLNQTIMDQFGSGLVIQITGTDLKLDADVVRASFNNDKTCALMGCKFRTPLTLEQCLCLQIEPPPPAAPSASPVQRAVPTRQFDVHDTENAANINELMYTTVDKGATDLHIKVGFKPFIRVSGLLVDIGKTEVTQEMAHSMVRSLMTAEQANRFDLEGDIELTYTLHDVGRFRINIFRQQGYTGMALRCIPDKVPTMQELRIPPVAIKLAEKPNGLVLVTGPTGSGKTSTLAAMINHINRTRNCNILTMEDPIEYVHQSRMARINQREIGVDVPDFATALKRGLRQDPDVMMIGEMRDLETISLALTAAETGHLVFATLHTSSAAKTPGRIIDVFPPGQHGQIRVQLADSLQGIMSQILLPGKQGGLILAMETLIATEGIRALIRDNKTSQIPSLMQTGASEGMQTLETALNGLLAQDLITYETALSKAENSSHIKPL